MTTTVVGAVAGALLGLSLAFAIDFFRPWHPVLVDGLRMLDERHRPGRPRQRRALSLRATQLLRHLPDAVDAKDLRIVGVERDQVLVRRSVETLGGAASGPLLLLVMELLDIELPGVVALAFTVVGGAAGWTGAARRIQRRADSRREEMRYALVAYLQQVSLLRRGGAGVATALRAPASLLGRSWAMGQIARQLDLAERSGQMPWEGLRQLSETIDLPELDDLAAITRAAGTDGGAVIDTLLARAETLEDELREDARAEANRASGRMSTPGALQVLLIAAWVLYPATTVLLSL